MTWIDHNGQSRPVHADLSDEVFVRFRDGYESQTPVHVWTFMGAGNNWKRGGPADPDNEIVAYRVVRHGWRIGSFIPNRSCVPVADRTAHNWVSLRGWSSVMNKREWILQAALVVMGKNLPTLTHDTLAKDLSDAYDAIVAVTPEEPAWIAHQGAKPYPEGMVDVILRDGMERFNVDSDELIWDHDSDPGDIIAWRPA